MRKEAALSEIAICDTGTKVGRKLRYPDKIIAPLPAGSLARMMAVLVDGEDKTDLLRDAVERELKRREELPRTHPPPQSENPFLKARLRGGD